MNTNLVETKVSLKKIDPSPLNPRKTFDQQSIAALAESIVQVGLLQPIIVRPRAKDRYEIVAGERRYRACEIAGFESIDCQVVELTDVEVLKIAMIENEQRDEVSDLERAEGYYRLVNEFKLSLEEVAKEIGKSVSTVRNLLRLPLLPADVQKAFKEGLISSSVASLIASRPSTEMREKLATFALTKTGSWVSGKLEKVLPSFREVKAWSEQHCMVELKQAPFPLKEPNLNPVAGDCMSCPKRTGNNKEEYPNSRPDVCTDPACYNDKKKTWLDLLVVRAERVGNIILPESKAKKLFPYGEFLDSNEYVDFKDPCYQDQREGKKTRTYGQLLEKSLAPEQIFVCQDANGDVHRLVERKTAADLLSKHHKIEIIKKSGTGNSDVDNYREKEKKAAKAKKEKARKMVDEAFQRLTQKNTSAKIPVHTLEVLKHTIAVLVEQFWGSFLVELCKARGLKGKGVEENRKLLLDLVDQMNLIEAVQFLGEISATRTAVSFDEKKANSVKKWFPIEEKAKV